MPTGTKTWVAPTGQRTVLQLQGTAYQITLLYLGHDRIAHDNARYRCRFEFHRGNAAITTWPAVVGNVVSGETPDEDSVAAATPVGQGGDTRNPPGETAYRVMTVDNHGLRTADSGFLGGGTRNRENKPDNYEDRNWMRDVSPHVPFRIVVRKLRGRAPVNIDGDEKVILEIKDSAEEFDQNHGRPRAFLERFFNRFNRTGATPDPGDDNAEVQFKGVRPNGGVLAASRVMKRANYSAPPALNAAPNGPNSVTFSSLSAATAQDTTKVQYDLTSVQEDGVNVGVADAVFAPWPAGGDNYRFLLTVVKGDQDVRDQEVNGAPVQLLDQEFRVIPKPRAYVAARIVIWRRVEFRLLVLADNTSVNDIGWDFIRNTYRRDFIEVIRPTAERIHNLSRDAWRRELRREFDPGHTNAQFNNAANFNAAAYNQGLFPTFLQPSATMARMEHMARRCIKHACTQVAPAINPDPDVDTAQDHDYGFFLFFCKLAADLTDFAAAGASFGDRMFWFAAQGTTDSTTSTTAHELGHALYLRHSYVNWRRRRRYVSAGGASERINLAIAHDGSNPEDHDQADAFACLMSYSRPVTAEPCGMCALVTRFYDRQAVSTQFANETAHGLDPAVIVLVDTVHHPAAGTTPASNEQVLREAIPNLAHGSVMRLAALGKLTPFTTRAPENLRGRAVLTSLSGSNWTKTGGTGNVSFAVSGSVVRVTGTARGPVTIQFSYNGVTATANFTVT